MMLQKRLYYGFDGYQALPTPRAARSVRKRCLVKSKGNDQQMCAFDLLATVAGKILLEGESSPPSVVEDSSIAKEENNSEHKPIEEKSCHERNFLFTELVSEAPNSNLCLNELSLAQNDVISRPASGVTTSEGSEKVGSAEQLVNDDDCKLRLGICTPRDVDSSGFKLPSKCESSRKQIEVDSEKATNLSITTPALVSSVDSVNLVSRDDGDNSSELNKAFRPQPRVGDCLVKKFLTSKHLKVAPINVKDDRCYNNADTQRCNLSDSKNSIKRHRSLGDYPFKKRKLYYFSSVSNSDQGIISSDGNSNGTTIGGGVPSSRPASQGVIGTPTSAAGERTSFHSKNHKVKLKIKSFRVPELYIEIPENATVGSLKRKVMEAVNEVLGGGLRVGVILQGKKIRDDNRTLLQTGISHDNKMDNTLGFTLEPSPVQGPIPSCPGGQLLHETPQPLASVTDTRSLDHQPRIDFNNLIESDDNNKSATHDPESRALVPVHTTKPDDASLGVVPFRKSKQCESGQRRIRRPFTVAEVEALVQAVEKLGTGRWRDVKMRAFDSAKHRTYVDLKDKWKTLVHTARISPQQRRGEPVPQELLDRVLAAHAYWSPPPPRPQQQHPKPPLDTILLL
ncbi:hypothetical protein ACJIZ3_012542 [Penstemon smallii]|uniref:Telomere repeat-binding protein 5 n=1 Tax=Penstemon smallii TaxID=265156 RepID=A0ABD3UQW8_9LAMI